MIDVKNKKCYCGKAQPFFNELGETKAIYCSSCKTDTMIDVKVKNAIAAKHIQIITNQVKQKQTTARLVKRIR